MKTFVNFFVAALLVMSTAAMADWDSYIIRNANNGSGSPGITDNLDGSITFETFAAGQKAALGTNEANGSTLGDILTLSIDRSVDSSFYGPYLNFWVTDGNGHYAVIANEPSDIGSLSYQYAAGEQWNLTWDILSTKIAKVYETNNPGWVNAYNTDGGSLLFSEIASLVISAPPASYVVDGNLNGVGSGAPDELGTYNTYGVNWVFGDTLSNYVGGCTVSNASITVAVPAPGAILLSSFGTMLVGRIRRRA